jgi:hypothetical protein
MPRALRTLAVLLLVALVPVRAVAGVTIGFCASGHHGMRVAAQGGSHHGMGDHAAPHGNEHPAQPVKASCSICVEHCSSAAFAPAMAPAVIALPAVQDRILLAERVAPAFFPSHPDRPPLA